MNRNLQASAIRALGQTGNRTNNITINIASDRNPNEIARAVVNEARPYLDEMEVARATNRNPRNNQSLSPVYG